MKTQERGTKYTNTYDKIYEKKLVLNNLVDLFKEFKTKEATELESDLQQIKNVYDGIKEASQLNKENMQKLSAAVAAARNKAIQ